MNSSLTVGLSFEVSQNQITIQRNTLVPWKHIHSDKTQEVCNVKQASDALGEMTKTILHL